VILPPARIGVLGGGQLGRYTVIAARAMGYGTAVLDADPLAPAGVVADSFLVAPFDDDLALRALGSMSAVVTVEFENPPVESLRLLAGHTCMRPAPDAIAVAQDRRREKRFLADHGFPVAPFVVIEDEADIDPQLLEPEPQPQRLSTDGDPLSIGPIDGPAILKSARLGYDGKGQVPVGSRGDLRAAWRRLGAVPCVLEQRLPLEHEVSAIIARTVDGTTAVYDIAENRHVDGILDMTVVPARVASSVTADAQRMALDIAAALDYVGVLAVEFFVVGGRLVVNEIAPRPHNSGHWTLDAARTSQFEQQVRAACGVALGDVTRTVPAVAMVNLLGDLWAHGEPDWSDALTRRNAHLHLYGKAQPRPGRKMGHLTVTAGAADEAIAAAVACRTHVGRGARLDR
jgi:5-(carboxyamino)imidazole ribonucleotide synthase